ncbi:hypothetical protein [Paenibacillus borealis]|uniref:Uncharacterized protein n=1 Tax=Paenibacillus borealis TaxID=160799 RepID=A0A089MIZ9_PAEBO|nr:hypothetical protein [Paenibacillus borealis]AIQ56539.1 hypothetical protein PBOR_05995 [Paenibacillus borealis]
MNVLRRSAYFQGTSAKEDKVETAQKDSRGRLKRRILACNQILASVANYSSVHSQSTVTSRNGYAVLQKTVSVPAKKIRMMDGVKHINP